MEADLFDFLGKLFSGALSLADMTFSGVPVAKDAITWAFFIVLVMNLIVLPIRGYGSSDRALAKDIRAGRAESTRAIQESRAQSKALRSEAMQRYYHRGVTEVGPRRRNGRF